MSATTTTDDKTKSAAEIAAEKKKDDTTAAEIKAGAYVKLHGKYFGYNTLYSGGNDDFGGLWRRWDWYPSYPDKLIQYPFNQSYSYNFMRFFLYPWYIPAIPISFIGGCIEWVVFNILAVIDADEYGPMLKKMNAGYEVAGPFEILGEGLKNLFSLPYEFIYNWTWLLYWLIGNTIIHIIYFDWYILQIFGISIKWFFDVTLVVFSNFYNGA